MIYAAAAIVLAIIGGLIYAEARGRRAGAAAEQSKVAAATVETMKAQDKAAAEAPHSREAVQDALDRGTF